MCKFLDSDNSSPDVGAEEAIVPVVDDAEEEEEAFWTCQHSRLTKLLRVRNSIQCDEAEGFNGEQLVDRALAPVFRSESYHDEPEVREDQVKKEDEARRDDEEEGQGEERRCQDGLRKDVLAPSQ